jgi:HEAT repeat protein
MSSQPPVDDSTPEKGAVGPSAPNPGARSADDTLPPVQPPTIGFLLQLFFIPLIIVTAIVLVWGMFSWLAHMGSNPRDLVKDLRAMNDASWQSAYRLSEDLRNPEYAELKKDKELAGELAKLLEEHLDDARLDKSRLDMRVYLCRALGEFELVSVANVLARAASQETDVKEIAVRRSAIEGLATLAGNIGEGEIRDHEAAMKALFAASKERDTSDEAGKRDAIRSAAAYALGVIGGKEPLERLSQLLVDAKPNVRFNAATGLARHGDVRCLAVLIDMLDPNSETGVEGNLKEGLKIRQKLVILTSAIFAASRMVDAPKGEDLGDLEDALQKLIDSKKPRAIRVKAKEALIVLRRYK